MKRLIVRSDTAEEDKQAVAMINREMQNKDTDQILWYSNMGQQVADMAEAAAIAQKLGNSVSGLVASHSSLSSKLSDLKFGLSDVKKSLKALQARVEEVNAALDTKESKKTRMVKNEKESDS